MSKLVKLLISAVGLLIVVSWLWAVILYSLADLDVSQTRPWTVYQLLTDSRTSEQVMKRILIIGAGLVCVVIAVGAFIILTKKETAFGDARFARADELAKAGLRDKEGLVLGKHSGSYLVNNGQTHVLVAAPTGSGKGVGIVIPNLLSWPGSALVLDVKGENYQITSGFRENSGQEIFVFSPLSGESHRYNPFDAIKGISKERRLTAVQNMAMSLLPDPEKGDVVWAQQGRALFVGLSLYLLDAPDRIATLGEILRHLQTEQETTDICKIIIADYREHLDPTALRSLANFSQQDQKLAESVKLGLVGALSLWENPLVDAATSATDFDISTLRARPTTIYMVVGLADLKTLRPLLRLFVEQVFAAQLRKEPGPDEPHKVLFLLDEFESLGTMSSIVDNLPFVRSYSMRIMAIIQGLTQLDQRYGEAGREKILQASAHQIFFASNDERTTKYISNRLGQKTIVRASKSVSRNSTSTSRSEMGRALMMPQEVARLPADKEIIFVEGHYPVKGTKVRYFADKFLKKRADMKPSERPRLKAISMESPTFDTKVVSDKLQDEIADMASDLEDLL